MAGGRGKNNSKKKGQKDKDKKKENPCQKNPKVVPKPQNANESNNSKANNSQDLICAFCTAPNDTGEWLVQCDSCDAFVHFSCAGISEIDEDEPWLCDKCKSDSSQHVENTSINETLNEMSNRIEFTADIHNHPRTTLEDIVEQPEDLINVHETSQIEILERLVESTSQPNILVNLPDHVSTGKSKTIQTITSSSSNRRQQIELQRIEEELKLQAEVDAETLQLKLEALKMKEVREKKYLEEKYKALSEKGGSSVSSRQSKSTRKSTFVSDWIEDQQNRDPVRKAKSIDDNEMRLYNRFRHSIDEMNFDVSIPIEDHEINKIRATLLTDKSTASNRQFIEEQRKLYLAWRDKNKDTDNSKDNQSKLNDKMTQDHHFAELNHPLEQIGHLQPNVSVAVEAQQLIQRQEIRNPFNLEFKPLGYTKGFQFRENRLSHEMNKYQQRKITSLSHTANEFNMLPKSRSTLLPAVSESKRILQNNIVDVQDPNSRYAFARDSQPLKLCDTNSGKPIVSAKESTGHSNQCNNQTRSAYGLDMPNERNTQFHYAYEPAISSMPKVSTIINNPHENQRNNQFTSVNFPVTWNQPTNFPTLNAKYENTHEPPIVSSVGYKNTGSYQFQSIDDPLTSYRNITSSIENTKIGNQRSNQLQLTNENATTTSQKIPQMYKYYDQLYSFDQADGRITQEIGGTFNHQIPPNERTYPNQNNGTAGCPISPNQRTSSSDHRISSNHPMTAIRRRLDDVRFPKFREPLSPSQIASRHAINKELPKFDGDSKDWCRFITRYFNSTDMCGYSDDENLERFDRCLQGKAHTLVKSLLMMPNAIPEILETLYEKYGRPELIIKSILNDVRRYPVLKSDNLEMLSDYGYAVWNACKQIEELKLQNYLINPELIQDVVNKLPYQTKIDWARHSGNLGEVTLRHLADWLHELARAINKVLCEGNSTSNVQKTSDYNKSEKKTENSTEDSKGGWIYLHNDYNKSSENSIKQVKCPICKKDCESVEVCANFKNLDINQRWESLKSNYLCRKCLKSHKRNCLKACGINGCEFKHHYLLHNEQRHSKNPSNSTNQIVKAEEGAKQPEVANKIRETVSTGRNNTHLAKCGELFRIVPVLLYANDRIVATYAYLDEGSSFILMERKIAEILGLTGVRETLCLLWTNNVHRQEESEIVNLEIAGKMSEDDREPSIKYPFRAVNVVEDLNLPEQSLPLEQFKERYEHLRNIPMVGYEKVTPTLLIGIKHAKLAVPLVTVEGEYDGPIATRSRLGWSIYGPGESTSSGYVKIHRVIKCPCQERDDDVHRMIKDHFTIENFGVVANSVSLESKENEKALEMLKILTVRKGNRFETGLLWKNDAYQLPDSYGMARKRLECLENKGSKVVNIINEAVEDYLKKGYVSKLSSIEAAKTKSRIWYLPMFTVSHPKKPEKLRSVFDAAAKVKGTSLNSVLHTGPDLLVSIVDVLRRFRESKIAFCGDIREMYHQVFVREEDRHAQRFLWRNGDKGREPEIYVMNVMTFGATCSPSAAQYVKNLNASEFQAKYPRAAKAIIKNHYVDDLMDGTNTIEEAIKLINDVKFIHSQGGFEIRNFKSNSTEVLRAIGEQVIDDEKVSVENGVNLERVLGMFWDTKSDCFTFSLKYTKVSSDVLTGQKLPTKRELLKLLMSIFDPLGLLSHYLVQLKILLQDVWRSKIAWDEFLPENLRLRWTQWIEILKDVEKLKIPRWYLDGYSEPDQSMHFQP